MCFPALLALDSPLDSLEPLFPCHYINVHNLTGVVNKPSFRINTYTLSKLKPVWTI